MIFEQVKKIWYPYFSQYKHIFANYLSNVVIKHMWLTQYVTEAD